MKRFVRALMREVRPHQWAKNGLLFMPPLLAPGIPEPQVLGRALAAACAFSLCASAGYVLNDLLDIEADRLHATKKERPFASGALPVTLGPPLGIGLVAGSAALSYALLPTKFLVMLGIYLVGTIAYSLVLKKILLVDVLVLAGLYAHRVLSGGVATDIDVSAWLLGFSIFFFTSLAFAKRYVELRLLATGAKVKNRGYVSSDLEMVTAMGTGSALVSTLVFMLYVDSPAVRASYREPMVLGLALPVLMYWLGRVWLLAGRGKMQDDPVRFALKDRTSLACWTAIGAIALLARFTPSWIVSLLH
jgi:4-hydroxybenzoate polyprenyltransferase